MTRYHINPDTGNANICRATFGNCPYEKEIAEHYASKQEAQSAYEEHMENPISEISRLIILQHKIQQKIIRMFDEHEKSEHKNFSLRLHNPEFDALIKMRSRITGTILNYESYNIDDSVKKYDNTSIHIVNDCYVRKTTLLLE